MASRRTLRSRGVPSTDEENAIDLTRVSYDESAIYDSEAEEEEESNRKRRRTNTSINYSLKREYHRGNNSNNSTIKKEHKKKTESIIKFQSVEDLRIADSDSIEIRKQKVTELIARHDLMSNELFQLKEYKSLVYWEPLENYHDKSEKYANFKESSRLQWTDEIVNNDLPLRLQKKRNQNKNPYKDEILQNSDDLELKLLGVGQPTTPKKAKPQKSKPISTPKERATPIKKHIRDVEKIVEPLPSESESEEEQEEAEHQVEVSQYPTTKVKKIRLTFSAPKTIITHPSHEAKPQFDNIQHFLDSYRSLEEDVTLEEYQEYIDSQNALMDTFRKGIKNKLVKLNEEGNRIDKMSPQPKFPQLLRDKPLHHDYLLGQGMHLGKLYVDLRKERDRRNRKIVAAIDGYFKKKAGEGDRLKKEQERKLRAIARTAVTAVRRRWTQAEKAFRILQKQREEEEKLVKGKEHLTKMLEHSTQLLEAQLTSRNPDQSEVSEESSDDGGAMDSDDNFSSESEEQDHEPAHDLSLTVEQLREKYADLDKVDMNNESNQSASGGDEESESDEDDGISGSGLSALYGNSVDTKQPTDLQKLTELTEDEQKMYQMDQDMDVKMLDESDLESSSLSDSDDESSAEDDSDTASENEEEEETGGKGKSDLADLFGKVVDNSDDESVKSEASLKEEGSTTPVSTPDSNEGNKAENNVVADVPLPSLLRGTLRPYQKQGLNWLASLYNNNTNGILADEMGLGKTIQTISLISYLACEKGIWGPHLIVVPTSVMLNWEMEFKRFAPGFKVMTYYGSPQQRKEKRKGWNNPDSFHICITSYQLVVQDHQAFRRKRWRYMILDEAHNIKNFRSTRWQALLNFNTEHRLLLTGTPLQNNIMELWSLLYFLMPSTKINQAMPSGFANLADFQTWFGRPVDKILEADGGEADLETKKTVSKLHQVLRPYLLRRLKADVEKQMPAKHEHIIYCRLSKRQRYLYDDFMSRAQTRETLASGNFLSIINCLMQLRKVCNHPDLFEVRPIVTSFAMENSVISSYSGNERLIRKLSYDNSKINLSVLNLEFLQNENMNTITTELVQRSKADHHLQAECKKLDELLNTPVDKTYEDVDQYYDYLKYEEQKYARDHLRQILYLNSLRCQKKPVYGNNLVSLLSFYKDGLSNEVCENLLTPVVTRSLIMKDTIEKYSFVTPPVVALDMKELVMPSEDLKTELLQQSTTEEYTAPFHQAQVKLSIAFPDKSLLQYDCGKLQRLATLLQDLKDGGHRALIFTQMTKVLDILEQFLNIHGYRYMRLDGSTKIEDRQILTERFNKDSRITCFILSTRSGGLGINLTGADTVIFYDSDWNPAMDKQCQDRCHRIGQTRDVHIYRFVSESTIESNILRKANQKRLLDNVVIQEGDFTTDYFGKFSVKDLLGDEAKGLNISDDKPLLAEGSGQIESVLAQAEDEDDAAAANLAMKEVEVDNEDFDETNIAQQEKSNTATPSQTPAPTNVESESMTPAVVEVPVKNNELEDIDFEDGVGHVDEYMLRFIADGNFLD